MKTLTLILGIVLMGTSLQMAEAKGNEVGNGGTARACENKSDGTKSLELLDYWEGKIINPRDHLDLGPGTFEQKIQNVLSRLETYDPYRA